MGSWDGARTRWREHELAGGARAGAWSRARARRTQRGHIRSRWAVYAVAVAIMAGGGLGAAALMPSTFLKGLVIGLTLAAVPSILWSMVVQVTGTAPIMMGDQAEQWTASELRKLGRHGWRLINRVLLRKNADIDHVLIGSGGMLAVETKWCATWDSAYGRTRQRDAAKQALENARLLGLWAPIRKLGVQVQPVVVLWGPEVRHWSVAQQIRHIDGVPIITGPSLNAWATSFATNVLTPEQVQASWTAIDVQVASREPGDEAVRTMPLSLQDVVRRIGAAVVGAYLGLVFVVAIFTWTRSLWWAGSLGLASALVAGVGFKYRPLRWSVCGWVAGTGATVLGLLGAVALVAVA